MSDLRKIIEDSVAILENSRIQTTDIFHVERTITKLKEALEQPQSKCKCGLNAGDGCQYCNRELHIETLEERVADLEQPQQEPEAYLFTYEGDTMADTNKDSRLGMRGLADREPLYTHTSNVRRISDTEILDLSDKHYTVSNDITGDGTYDIVPFARALIEIVMKPKECEQ